MNSALSGCRVLNDVFQNFSIFLRLCSLFFYLRVCYSNINRLQRPTCVWVQPIFVEYE